MMCVLQIRFSVLLGSLCRCFCQAEDGIRDLVRSRGLGDVYKRQLRSGAGGVEADAVDRFPDHVDHVLAMMSPAGAAPVSYTHLTLPTSDLV